MRDWVAEETWLEAALATASSSLHDALRRPPSERRRADKAEAKLLRYLIRMSTRPTPFALFAGVAVCRWAAHTDLELAEAPPLTRTRPDMSWLLSLVFKLESDVRIRRELVVHSNRMALVRGSRVFLAERAPTGKPAQTVSLRATRPVMRALAIARSPILYRDLAAELRTEFPTANGDQIDDVLTNLWEQTLLLTDLRPPITALDPACYVARRLASIPAAHGVCESLEALLDATRVWDGLSVGERADGWGRVSALAGEIHPAPEEGPLQVDMAIPLAGNQISRAVGDEACRAAELLLRMSSAPRGLQHVLAYRDAFHARYGDREVPLVELLDPNFGLGPIGSFWNRTTFDPVPNAQKRNQALLELAWSALHSRAPVVELDEETVQRLETWAPDLTSAPVSLDLCVFVGSPGRAALDAGDFIVVVGPNVGALAAGRTLGRFAHVIGDAAAAALCEVAEAEQSRVRDRLLTEVAYMPHTLRSTNVAIRTLTRRFEIDIGVSPGDGQPVPVDELVVGHRQGKLYVRWTAEDAEIEPCSGHMLNSSRAPEIARFLVDVARGCGPQLSGFDWGPATGFPYLPRVQSGRVVLRPAQWRIGHGVGLRADARDASTFGRSIAEWRDGWKVPRYVHLGGSDNRLVLDLEDADQLEELRVEAAKVGESGQLIVQEVIPSLEEAWIPGPRGRHVTEFVIQMTTSSEPAEQVATTVTRLDRRAFAISGAVDRQRGPGTEWLFAKLYHPPALEEDLLVGHVADFVCEALRDDLVARWFFIRYSDPDRHLRVRFNGRPEALVEKLIPRLCTWANALVEKGVCTRFALDTYDRELERFGGHAGNELAESAFTADSNSALELLQLLREFEPELNRTSIAVASLDGLLAALGLDEAGRLAWCRKHVRSRHESSAEYRDHKQRLRTLVGGQDASPAASSLRTILSEREQTLAPIAAAFRHLALDSRLDRELDDVYSSLVHLHCNRLGGINQAWEQLVFGLLLRTREGLDRAPVGVSASQAG